MSDTLGHPWSNNSNAPNIPYELYFQEKSNFAGTFISSMLYGMSEHPHLHVRLLWVMYLVDSF